jgi:hypothetical protein
MDGLPIVTGIAIILIVRWAALIALKRKKPELFKIKIMAEKTVIFEKGVVLMNTRTTTKRYVSVVECDEDGKETDAIYCMESSSDSQINVWVDAYGERVSPEKSHHLNRALLTSKF